MPDAPTPAKPRRSQEERRREMRARLAAATLESLGENGYHGASLSDILGRAGVSRGAWAHHFSSKLDLVALAAEEMLRESTEVALGLVPADLAGGDRLAALLEATWARFYQGPRRDVLFEVALACRTDAELRARLAPVFAGFIAAVGQAGGRVLRPRPGAAADVADLLTLTIYMLRGMALQEVTTGPDGRNAALRALWARLLGAWVEVG